MATTARRPRIPEDLAEKIDAMRLEIGDSFEEYVRGVLERHVDRYFPNPDTVDENATRVHHWHDPMGAWCWIDKVDGGWGDRKEPGIVAGMAIDDEGYDPVGIHLDRPALRALRDVCTELLEQTETVEQATIHAIR